MSDADGLVTLTLPMWARLHLTHAVMQAVADETGTDVLHVKGPAVAAELRSAPRRSTDVDVLVRPAHLARFLSGMRAHGWSQLSSFAEGSSFAHAANWGHPLWTFVDVHRFFPGPTVPAADVFDELWAGRHAVELAHVACAVPSLAAQLLVLALHEARSHRTGRFEAWDLSDAERRDETWLLARRLGAEVPLAAALGRLDEYRGRRDYPLWKFWSEPESGVPGRDRLTEWAVRFRAARTLRERAFIASRMVRVNRTHLGMELGHSPTAAEMRAEYRHRVAAGWHGVVARLRRPRA